MSLDRPRLGKLKAWRVAVDRAWRSPELRREFEAESGLSPLAEYGARRSEQVERGHVVAYEEQFREWATKKLNLGSSSHDNVRGSIGAR